MKLKTDIFSVNGPLSQLYRLPLAYMQNAPDSDLKGWFIYLSQESSNVRYRAYPGVFSTSFAIQLLSNMQNSESRECRQAILAGMTYLLTQFTDSEFLDRGETKECKQRKKRLEVGHHDFKLTMKLCAMLEARNAIANIVEINQDYATLLYSHRDIFDRITSRLKSTSREYNAEGVIHLAWPWHSLTDDAELDPFPTSHALLALTETTLRGSGQWLKRYDCAINYLKSIIKAESTMLISKVVATKTLLILEKRLNRQFLEVSFKEQMINELGQALSALNYLSWQEIMHYQVPSLDGTQNHYKPWIWTFPRIDFAECFCLLGGQDQHDAVYMIASDIIRNIKTNQGKVVFLRSINPTLLASFRSAQFLETFHLYKLADLSGKISFASQRISHSLTDAIVRYPRITTTAIIVLLLSYVYPGLSNDPAMMNSLQLLNNAALRMSSVWPIWVGVFIVSMIISKGTFVQRLYKSFTLILVGGLLDLIVNLIAAPSTVLSVWIPCGWHCNISRPDIFNSGQGSQFIVPALAAS